MEDKQLTNQESLDLISKMIENTRRNFNNKGGMMFIIWGGTTIAVSIGVFLLVKLTGNFAYMWAWWSLPVIGGTLTLLHLRRTKTGVRTYMDKIVRAVWIVAGIMCVALPIIDNSMQLAGVAGYNLQILFTTTLLISGATAITGLLIDYIPVTIGGFTGIALAFLLPLFGWEYQTLLFAFIFLVAQMIPGIMLSVKMRKTRTE